MKPGGEKQLPPKRYLPGVTFSKTREALYSFFKDKEICSFYICSLPPGPQKARRLPATGGIGGYAPRPLGVQGDSSPGGTAKSQALAWLFVVPNRPL